MKRVVLMALSVVLALALAAPVVSAQPNKGASGDASGTIVINPGDYPGSCDFPFSLDLSGKGKTMQLPDEGLILTSPGLDVTITNLEAPENRATFNITGSVHQSTLEDGSVVTVLTARNFAIHPVAGTTIVVGRFSYTFDAEGNLIQPQTGTGQSTDVCALLGLQERSLNPYAISTTLSAEGTRYRAVVATLYPFPCLGRIFEDVFERTVF